MIRSLLIFLGLSLVASGAALAEMPSNGYIGVFGDAAGTNCCITLTKSGNSKLFVYAVTGGASSEGLSGAEFKISVEPTAPDARFLWNPASGINVSVGDPVDNGDVGAGATVSFAECQTQTGLAGDKVLLGTLHVFHLTGEHRLVIRQPDAPMNATFTCPSMLLCDSPSFTQVCLTLKQGDPALAGEEPAAFVSALNASSCEGTSCGFVATESSTWSTIKDLYR
jgi:hypothetical protein